MKYMHESSDYFLEQSVRPSVAIYLSSFFHEIEVNSVERNLDYVYVGGVADFYS